MSTVGRVIEPGVSHRPRHSAARGGRGRLLGRLMAAALILAGAALLLYPVLATQYNNVKQRQFTVRYNSQVMAVAPDALGAELDRARDYNATLTGVPILDPYLSQLSDEDLSQPYAEYLDTLASFDVMARIRVPAVGVDLPVYHGTSDEVIGKGVGHLYGTSLPVGGVDTHSVLTSHTGMTNATLFDNLADVKEGDVLYVNTYGQTLAYSVDSIKVVLPTQIEDLQVVRGADLLTLFTCTPYAVNTHRLLVTGHRIPYEAEAEPAPTSVLGSALEMEPWMYWFLGGALVALLLLAVFLVRDVRAASAHPTTGARDE